MGTNVKDEHALFISSLLILVEINQKYFTFYFIFNMKQINLNNLKISIKNHFENKILIEFDLFEIK